MMIPTALHTLTCHRYFWEKLLHICDVWSNKQAFWTPSREPNEEGPGNSTRRTLLYIRQATLRLLWSSEAPTLMRVFGPTHAKASTSHSYQTLVSSVWRHMLTSSSVSWGKYSGCWNNS